MWDSDVSYLLRAMNEENSWKTWHLTGSRKMPPTTAWTSFRAICTAFVGTGEAKEVRIWTDWCCKIGAVRCSIFWHLFRLKVTLRSPKFLFEAGHSEVAQLRWVQSGHAWVLPTKHTQDLFFRFRKDFGFCFSLCDISNAYALWHAPSPATWVVFKTTVGCTTKQEAVMIMGIPFNKSRYSWNILE